MTVQEKIKSIVEGMGETYIFDNWQTANVKLDKGVLPYSWIKRILILMASRMMRL